MNVFNKRIPFFILFFSVFTFTAMYPYYGESAHAIVYSGWQSDSREVKANKSHHDFSHDSTWNNSDYSRPSGYRHQFSKYTLVHDFQQHFTAIGYTEKQILNQRCLYMFDEFVKFAQTYSSYRCTIQELYATLKNLNWLQKAYYTAKGTYCIGLQKRIQFLYNELGIIKTTQHNNTAPVLYDYSLATFSAQISEYKTLDSPYRRYAPSLSAAIEKRIEAYNKCNVDYAQFANKSYTLNNNIKQLLYKHRHDQASFDKCFGNALHQAIHREALDIFERIDCLPHGSLLYDHQEALIDFTVAMVDYNHEGLTDKAMHIADLCWTLLDYGQAVAEGAVLGVYCAVTDIITNPIEATVCIVAGKQVLAYQLCKVLYNVVDIGVTSVTDFDHAKEKWNSYAAPLNNIIDAIYKKEITVRDVIKSGTVLVVGCKAQGKLLGGLGKFCNIIKQKSINFVQNNTLLNRQEYLTTPEGLLFKATSQSNKPKRSGQEATATNLNTTGESTVVKNDSIKKSKPTTQSALTSNFTASKEIIHNVTGDLRSTITRYKDHIFSPDHIRDGIMALGKDTATIMNSLCDVILSADKKGLLQEGPNQMRAMINGIDNIEIRCFIEKGKIISVNAFISDFGRIFSNFVDITKVQQ